MAKIQNAKAMAQEAILKLKKYGYLVGIIMVVMGVALFLRPVATSTLFIWILVFGMLITGFAKFFAYFTLPKEMRSGGSLALGIIWVICACLMITQAVNMPLQTTVSLQLIIGIIIGVNCIFSGIGTICASGQIKEMGGSAGLAIFSGVLELICGAIVISSPIFGLFALTVAFGIYLLVMGVAVIIRSIAY